MTTKKEYPLEVTQGTNAAYGLALTNDATGADYTLETDQVLVLGVVRGKLDTQRVLIKKITHAANGEYYLELTPEDTADLEPSKYYYNVCLQSGDTVLYDVIRGPFTILPNAVRLGDGA